MTVDLSVNCKDGCDYPNLHQYFVHYYGLSLILVCFGCLASKQQKPALVIAGFSYFTDNACTPLQQTEVTTFIHSKPTSGWLLEYDCSDPPLGEMGSAHVRCERGPNCKKQKILYYSYWFLEWGAKILGLASRTWILTVHARRFYYHDRLFSHYLPDKCWLNWLIVVTQIKWMSSVKNTVWPLFTAVASFISRDGLYR